MAHRTAGTAKCRNDEAAPDECPGVTSLKAQRTGRRMIVTEFGMVTVPAIVPLSQMPLSIARSRRCRDEVDVGMFRP
jgi:hypothetical protein